MCPSSSVPASGWKIGCDRSFDLAAGRAVTPSGRQHSPGSSSINGPEEARRWHCLCFSPVPRSPLSAVVRCPTQSPFLLRGGSEATVHRRKITVPVEKAVAQVEVDGPTIYFRWTQAQIPSKFLPRTSNAQRRNVTTRTSTPSSRALDCSATSSVQRALARTPPAHSLHWARHPHERGVARLRRLLDPHS